MATPSQNNFDIPKDGYVAFDALSLRQLILNRLNASGVYTDQNFIGSNLAAIVDIIAYTYNTLIYYLNRTSSESLFSEAQLYENINRIVKVLDYKPVGYQTSTLTFDCSATTLRRGLYTIPRYSYVVSVNNNLPFSFNEDITFAKTVDFNPESLSELASQKLLFQGRYREYPQYTAMGENYETVILDTVNSLVDHFNIDVYVKDVFTNTWKQYTKTVNLYLENGNSEKYEIRLNGNNRYEIKFGNDINGKKLQPGDKIAVYFLESDGTRGQIGPTGLDGTTTVSRFDTTQYNEILNNVSENQFRYLNSSELGTLRIKNTTASTTPQQGESVEEIKNNAPQIYQTQYRLVTVEDYEKFVKTNFSYLIADVKAANNWDYVSQYLKYFYDIGITNPEQTDRALYNQITFSDSCNFNNIYLTLVPKTPVNNAFNFLVPAQKEIINSSILGSKMLTTETVFIDPVYKAVMFGIETPTSNSSEDLLLFESDLVITKLETSRLTDQAIQQSVYNVFANYFDRNNLKLGQTLNISQIYQQILNVPGVQNVKTVRRNSPDNFVDGISLFVWNPLYPTNDYNVTQSSVLAKYFEYFYIYDYSILLNNIKVESTQTTYQKIEY